MGMKCCKPETPNDLNATATIKSLMKFYCFSTCCIRDNADIDLCIQCAHKKVINELKQKFKKNNPKPPIKTRLTI